MWTTLMLTGFLVGAVPAYEAPTGEYVEARTASVFAGACHFNGEYTTQGRRAVLGWSFESGAEAGIDLAGVQLVALVECDENLAELDAPRASTVHLSVTGPRADAALAWLTREHGALLGDVRAVHRSAALAVDIEGDTFELKLADRVTLTGDAMADRACCKMPFQVWYQPLQPLAGRLVGCPEEFLVHDDELGWNLDRAGDNNAQFGRFGGPLLGATSGSAPICCAHAE